MSTDVKTAIDDLNFASDRIGEQTRTIALGVLAVVWLFLAGGDDAPALQAPPSGPVLILAGGLCFASIVADYLQYLAAYRLSRELLNAAESASGEQPVSGYDHTSWLFRARVAFFWLKQALCLGAVGALVFAILRGLCGA